MFKTLMENGNVIYHFNPLEQVLRDSKVAFSGSGNILFLAPKSLLKNTNIHFYGNNALVFIGDSTTTKENIDVQHESVCYIGNANYFNPCGSGRWFCLSERKNLIIGNACLISHTLWFRLADPHLLYDSTSHLRINPSKSIYLGDHIWIGQEVGFLKGAFVGSGAVIGAKSLVTAKKFASNTINAGNPCKEIKNNIFWSGECAHSWKQEQTQKYQKMPKNDFKYSYSRERFLSPLAIEAKLESLKSALEKLEFVYDVLYCNADKNRFAYQKDCAFDVSLPHFLKQFYKLNFQSINPTNNKEEYPPKASLYDRIANLESALFGTAKSRIQNHLAYKIGQILTKDSKSFSGILKMPFKLSFVYLKHNKEQKEYKTKIKNNPNLKLPPLESYPDYQESLKIKKYFSYKIGEAFLNIANNPKDSTISAGGGGAISRFFAFIQKVRELRGELKQQKNQNKKI